MRNRKLASRYAQALLEALPDKKQRERADLFLSALARAFDASRELRDVLMDPAVPRSSRKAALVSIARRHEAPPRVENFLQLVVDHGRTGELPTIARVFHETREDAMGIVPAQLTTARPLAQDLKKKARQALEEMTGSKISLSYDNMPCDPNCTPVVAERRIKCNDVQLAR